MTLRCKEISARIFFIANLIYLLMNGIAFSLPTIKELLFALLAVLLKQLPFVQKNIKILLGCLWLSWMYRWGTSSKYFTDLTVLSGYTFTFVCKRKSKDKRICNSFLVEYAMFMLEWWVCRLLFLISIKSKTNAIQKIFFSCWLSSIHELYQSTLVSKTSSQALTKATYYKQNIFWYSFIKIPKSLINSFTLNSVLKLILIKNENLFALFLMNCAEFN